MIPSHHGQVVLAFGNLQTDALRRARQAAGPDSIHCTATARMAGAALAVGTPEALAELRGILSPGALMRQKGITPELSDEANIWLSQGNRCKAADTILEYLSGTLIVIDAEFTCYPIHPRTSDELRLCIRLLEEVPELKSDFEARMPMLSPEWSKIVHAWPSLVEKIEANQDMAAQVELQLLLEH